VGPQPALYAQQGLLQVEGLRDDLDRPDLGARRRPDVDGRDDEVSGASSRAR
jgi:hypothetical protein